MLPELNATSRFDFRAAGQKRTRIRELAKMLNLRGGVTILDTLSCADVMKMLEVELTHSTSA